MNKTKTNEQRCTACGGILTPDGDCDWCDGDGVEDHEDRVERLISEWKEVLDTFSDDE